MDYATLYGFFWLMYAVPALTLTLPVVWFGRRRVWWRPWEALAFIAPLAVWVVILFYTPLLDGYDKGLNNLSEPLIYGFAVPLAAVARVVRGERSGRGATVFPVAVQVALCLGAALVAVFFPDMGGTLRI